MCFAKWSFHQYTHFPYAEGCGPAVTQCEVRFFPKKIYYVLQSKQYEQGNKIVKGEISFHQYDHFAYA